MTLGDVINAYRTENDLSMDAFSEKSGISKAYISLLEKNKHPKTGKPIAPSIQCIKQAATGMNMDFNSLFSKLDGNVSLNDESNLTNKKLNPNNEFHARILADTETLEMIRKYYSLSTDDRIVAKYIIEKLHLSTVLANKSVKECTQLDSSKKERKKTIDTKNPPLSSEDIDALRQGQASNQRNKRKA